MRRKIILLIDHYPPPIGGMETHGYEFARFLKNQKEFDFRGVIAFAQEAKNSRVAKTIFPVRPILLPESAIAKPAELIAVLERRSIGPGDIIFFNSIFWLRTLPSIRKRFPNTLLVQRSGGNDVIHAPMHGEGKTLKERQQFVRSTINDALDLYIITSQYSKDRLARAGIRPEIMHPVVGGVDLSRFKPCSGKEKSVLRRKLKLPVNSTILIDTARLVPFKGVSFALKAFALAHVAHPKADLHFVIVGDGQLREELELLAAKLGVSRAVHFIGSIPVGNVHEYYRASDIFLHTPIRHRRKVKRGSYIHTESMGRCLIEASAASIPIVTTSVGGTNEIVQDGENGFLVPARDVKTVARRISQLVDDKKLRMRMGKKGGSIAKQQFAWKQVFAKYSTLFQEHK